VGRGRLIFAVAGALAVAAPAMAADFNPATEASNYSKINERAQYVYGTPEYQALLRERSVEGRTEDAMILATDPERDYSGNLCHTHEDGCAGDVRLWPKHWEEEGHGIAKPVLFTARNGSTLSGVVWATKAGPAIRPGIVITNGSVQAPDVLYLWAATTLAKAGFVVLTYDPQGQGRSDTYGEGVDRNDGFPSQNGQPFYDGTEDALDFLFSTPAAPYHPRKSCSTGTSHDEKQQRRVKAGLNAPYNPLSQLLDPTRVGIAGHSLGAAGVSYIGQLDKRVKAIVAWDNLRASNGGPAPFKCDSGSSPRPDNVPLTKPALGMSNDYGLTPQPYTAAPDEQAKNAGSNAYTKAGQPSGEINTRGGTHFEYSFIPNPGFGATLRGEDMAAWYTGAWFDRYVKGDESAEQRLKTSRWRADSGEAAIDPGGDGNLYSFYLKSRLAISGFTC
jgi:dienelactone hydrolase